MKNLFLTIILFCLISVSAHAADLIVFDKVESTGGISFDMESTGGWDAVTMPTTGIEHVRHVYIQVNDGSGTVSDTTEAFLFSFDSDGAEYTYVSELGMSIPLGKKAGEIIGYVKTAAAGSDITVLGLR